MKNLLFILLCGTSGMLSNLVTIKNLQHSDGSIIVNDGWNSHEVKPGDVLTDQSTGERIVIGAAHAGGGVHNRIQTVTCTGNFIDFLIKREL